MASTNEQVMGQKFGIHERDPSPEWQALKNKKVMIFKEENTPVLQKKGQKWGPLEQDVCIAHKTAMDRARQTRRSKIWLYGER